jgi:hypothetical protein
MMKKSILLAVSAGLLAMAAGCAAPGVPQPPSLRLPVAVDNLAAVRKGSRVILSWSPPAETTDHQAMRWPSITRICRVVNQFPTNVCEAVKEIKSSELATALPGARRPVVTYEDVLPPSLISQRNEATYAIEVINQRGHSAGLSNQVRVPLTPTPPAPADFHATLDAQGPLLHWSAPLLPAAPAISYRMRLYRRSDSKKDFTVVAEQAYRAGEDEARDTNFEWEEHYEYKATPVTVLETARPVAEIEGDDSATLRLAVRDTFPPAVPTGLQAVYSSVGQKPFIDLTWAPNTESDLVGYQVYRRTAGTGFVAISTGVIKAPAWRDSNVQPGQKYDYVVSAIDLRGNESAQSAVAEELVPLEVR